MERPGAAQGTRPQAQPKEQLQAFIRHAPIAMAMFDLGMNYLCVSDAWAAVFGGGRRDLAGLNHYEVVPDMPPEWRGFHQQGMHGAILKHEEHKWHRADGSAVWLSWSLQPWRDDAGEIGGIVIVADDVTERKRLEAMVRQSEQRLYGVVNAATDALAAQGSPLQDAALKPVAGQSEQSLIRSREQLRSFIRHAPVAIAMFDRDMNYLATSDDWLSDYGRGRTDLVGLNHYELFPDIPHEWRAFHQQGMHGAILKNNEEMWTLADGSHYWLRWSLQPWRDENGEIGGIVIAAEDITERKRLDVMVRESEQRLYGVVNAAMDAIVTVDENFRVILCNPAAETMFGVDAAEAMGQPLDRFLPARFRAGHESRVKTFGTEGRTSRAMGNLGEVTGLRADGEEFPIEATISEIDIQGKKLYTAIMRDITGRKRAEAELRSHEEKLRGLLAHQEHIKEEERIRIAREIHDELGSALTGCGAYLSAMIYEEEKNGAAPDGRLLKAHLLLDSAAETMRRVIADLRPSVLDELGVWAALEWYAEQTQLHTGLRCRVSVDPVLEEVALDRDRSSALFRILQESLTNVQRHAKAGKVEIRVRRVAQGLEMEVDDDGIGVAAASAAPGRQSWGLAGMKERARYLGGSVEVSDLSPGTRVAVCIPF